jgi:mono/diheme cytochrome c family protein
MRLATLTLPLVFSACSGADTELPSGYRGIAVPEAGLRSAEARQRGRGLFEAHCALCHGVRGDGRGARSEGLSRPPADFTDLAWRRRTTPRRVFFAVREGVRGTPMPSWKSLDESEAWDLVAYVLSIAEAGARAN